MPASSLWIRCKNAQVISIISIITSLALLAVNSSVLTKNTVALTNPCTPTLSVFCSYLELSEVLLKGNPGVYSKI